MTENDSSVALLASLPHSRTPSRRLLSNSPPSPTSLLERLTANGTVYSPDLVLPEDLAALTVGPSSLHAISAPNLVRSTWLPPRSARPLTPIMASPLTSPAPSMSPDITLTLSLSLSPDTEDGRGRKAAHSESAPCTETIPPNPTWMSTPPTPPPKDVHNSPMSVISRSHSSFVTASASFPNPTLSSVSKASSEVMKRRASLPLMSVLKPLPAIPPAPPPSSLKTQPKNPPRQMIRSSRSPLCLGTSEHSDERLYPACQSGKRSSQAALRAEPLFHLPHDSSDKEDDDLEELNDYRKNSDESSSEGANHRPRAKHDLAKDNMRKYHALLELLSTEVGYFLDLKILVTVYLRLLPVLTIRPSHSACHFSRSNSLSFTTPTSRTQSFPHLPTAVPLSPTLIFCENMPPIVTGPPSLVPVTKEKDKSLMRQIFSTADINLITRNAEDILKFHEQLVGELRALVSPLGLPMILDGADTNVMGMQEQSTYSLETLSSVLDAVAMKFIERAPGFDLYQSFCSRHPEAFNLVRKVQQEFPAEWDAFEQKCSAMAAEMRMETSLYFGTDGEAGNIDTAENTSSESDLIARMRRHSLSSLHAPRRQQSLSRFRSNAIIQARVLSVSESGHSDVERKSKLVFMDHLIKPIQRICRYTLLLDQLQDHPRSVGSSRASSSAYNAEGRAHDVEVDVMQSALNAMKAVTSSVDEARRQQDLTVKSSLIASRISQGLALVTATHSRPASRNLSSGFILSLGQCYLAGSLDVIHYHSLSARSSGTVKAKYLGAFLYAGGYLILAKVHKAGTYEPKHWFSLAGFDLVDSTQDEALLPSWFRLSGRGHIFEFAASCLREKDVWKAAVHHVFELPGAWTGEPSCSLRSKDTHEVISHLPTIQSIPELDVETEVPSYGDEKDSLSGGSDLPRSGRTSRAETLHKSDSSHQLGHSRRSSTITSNWAYLSTLSESDTIHLVRATAPAREQVDRGLFDVFSESCLSARCYAHTHEEKLFEASKVSHSFSRSSSGLTMAGAMSVAAKNRLTKRESVLVPRRRSYVDGFGHYDASVIPWVPQTKPGKKLRIVAVSRAGSLDGDEGRLQVPLESPSAISQYSSASVDDPEPIAASPVAGPGPMSAPSSVLSDVPPLSDLAARKEGFTPKRSRSMVENVRVLFSRSTSPALPLFREPSESSSGVTTSGLRKWWSKGTLRRRVRSAPTAPADELPSDATAASFIDPSSGSHPSMAPMDRPVSQPAMRTNSFPQSAPGSGTGKLGAGSSPPMRMRSLFGPQSLRRRSTTATSISSSPGGHEGISAPGTFRIRRNLSFLSRLSPMTPDAALQK